MDSRDQSGYTIGMTSTLPFRRTGRYRGIPAVEFDEARLFELIRNGATNADIAAVFRCCERTFERWRARNPEVNERIKAERARMADLFRW